MIYAILNDTFEFVEWRNLDVLPAFKAGRVRPQVVDALPAFDPATEKAVEGTPVVGADSVRKTWVVVSLSAEELAVLADGVSYQQVKNIYQDLRNGVGTQVQRAERLERVVAWLVKRIALSERGEIL